MKDASKFFSSAIIAMLLLSIVGIFVPVNAAPTTLELVNPLDGTHDLHFTTGEKSVGDTITINITVKDVADLMTWQVAISWDPTLLEYVNIAMPSDHIFAGKTIYPVGPDTSVPGQVIYGCVLGSGQATFTGSGTCAQLTLRIIKGVSMLEPSVECDIVYFHYPPYSPADTFLLNSGGFDIDFTPVNAHYRYSWVVPSLKPRFYIVPSTIKPAKINDPVDIDIYIADVDPNWQIIAFQFSIMWNTTFLAPRDPYWTRGNFMESFSYVTPPEDGVIYMADINTHTRLPPLHPIPDDYNYSSIAVILNADPATGYTYHPPFPSGGGKLATLHFTAIYETISPIEDWTTISFITFDEDMLVLNSYGLSVGYNRADPAQYRAPMKILGLAIDVYTQYSFPYGGQGHDMPSDMFGPQQQVELFALVTYNEYPVQQKLVGFHIIHNGYDIYREATTDADGIAHVSFRLPWPCDDPVDEIFGKWQVRATVEVAEAVANDTLGFWVWWPVEVLTVEPKHTEYVQRKSGGDPLDFIVEYGTYSMQIRNVILTVTVYDELGFFIGSDDLNTTVGWGAYEYYNFTACESPPYWTPDHPWEPTIPLPTNAVVGKGIVFGNAFTDFPWNYGVPYCPEVTNTIDFYIKKP